MTARKPEAATGKGEPVSLYYAKAFDGEWYLLNALASDRCKLNLRTTGWALLSEHPLPTEGLDDKAWTYAMFIGRFHAAENESWEGSYEGVWTEWKGR